jgi:hypothetical protein
MSARSSHSPVEGEGQIVVRPLLSLERPHFKTRKCLKKKNMVMCPDGTRNQEVLF